MADFALDDDLDLLIPMRLIDGAELVIQRVRIRLSTFRGEWLLDEREGIPYHDWIEQTPAPIAQIEAVLLDAIGTTPGVRRVDGFAVVLDSTSATFSATGTIVLDSEDPDTSIEVSVSPIRGAIRVRSVTN